MPANTTVKEWMTGNPVALDLEASLLEALDLMVGRGIRHLPVVDAERRVVGVVSLDDLAAALPFPVGRNIVPSPAQREAAREWRVGDVMTHAPEVLPSDAPLAEAAERMADRRIGCLPIVDESGRLAGILSETDALRALATSLWSERVRERRVHEVDLEALITELRRERGRITSQLDRLHAVERDLSTRSHDEPTDTPERGADLREVRLAERLDTLAARRLEAIDRALDHAAQGRLSICDGCGGRIPLTRLRALPGTTVCVACARLAESEREPVEEPFERPPGGRAETGRPELGARVYTRFGEGRLLRIVPFGTCRRCGDVEGRRQGDEAVCGNPGCRQPLEGVLERAIVRVEEREVYVDPAELRSVDPAPYD
jgi:CBS domain-containing protein/RNA polymerase-binding transcription factor DksA